LYFPDRFTIILPLVIFEENAAQKHNIDFIIISSLFPLLEPLRAGSWRPEIVFHTILYC
jgi:hypothetical protein